MLMSQDAISPGVASRPSPGPSASAVADRTSQAAAAATRRLGIGVRHLSVFADGPAGDTIEMIDCSDAAIRDQARPARLNIARLVCHAALQDGGAAVPAPRNAEPGQRFRQNRLLKGGGRPACSAISGD